MGIALLLKRIVFAIKHYDSVFDMLFESKSEACMYQRYKYIAITFSTAVLSFLSVIFVFVASLSHLINSSMQLPELGLHSTLLRYSLQPIKTVGKIMC